MTIDTRMAERPQWGVTCASSSICRWRNGRAGYGRSGSFRDPEEGHVRDVPDAQWVRLSHQGLSLEACPVIRTLEACPVIRAQPIPCVPPQW
ncbi:hypothetical protein GCM10018966_021590 [Streptomyces yanii]